MYEEEHYSQSLLRRVVYDEYFSLNNKLFFLFKNLNNELYIYSMNKKRNGKLAFD